MTRFKDIGFALLLGAVGSVICGMAEVLPAQLEYACAPWDGTALNLSMKYEGKVFRASVWPGGMALLDEGKPVVMDTSYSSNGMGVANLCSEGETPHCDLYAPGEVELQLPKTAVRAATPVHGNVVIRGQVVPIEVSWKDSQHFCG